MDEKEREAFYDAEIAPALLDIGKRCNEAGLSFLAVAEWAPGESGRTRQFTEPFGLPIEIADAAMRAGNNIDAFLMYIMKLGKERGHSSAILHQLGVPMTPTPA